jgi:hypothetical protein
MRAKRINSDIAIIIFLFASGASDFTPACALAAESTGRNPGSTERHSGPPEWWQFKRKRATAMTIETKVSEHALRQSQRRGISRETLDLVLTYHDRSRKLPGYARALWIGPRGRKALIRAGLPVALVERCAGVRAIVHLGQDLVLTVEHTCKRRRWV